MRTHRMNTPSENDIEAWEGEGGAAGAQLVARAIPILDPTKVTHTALQNVAPIASLKLATEALNCRVAEEFIGSER